MLFYVSQSTSKHLNEKYEAIRRNSAYDKSKLNDYETSKGDRQTHRPLLLSGNHRE